MANKPKGQSNPQKVVIGNVSRIYTQMRDGNVYDWGGAIPPYEKWADVVKWKYVPPTKEELKNIPWRYVWCGGYDVETDDRGRKVRKFHHFECKPCNCPPGPQVRALAVEADEIAAAGGRGSSKSEMSFAFLAKGDPALPPGDPVAATYINCPEYSFLVLRKNSKDLSDYFTRAKRFFKVLGGVATENPMTIKFPSGAFGIFDHVADGDAHEKYQGSNYTRIVWEEATQERDEENYLKILMSCRTSHEKMRAQMLLTANPGGRGAKWFNARFVRVKKDDGAYYKPGEYITYQVYEGETKTRVFIPSTVDDNPYMLRKGYDKQLELLKEKRPQLYRRWRFGDFDAVDGQAFEEFRDEQKPGEPPEACHVLVCTKERPEPVVLEPWWPRAIGMDYGYSHACAIGWGCWHPKKQLHVYRELVRTQLGTVAAGAELAQRSLKDLEGLPGHHMSVILSPDAFSRTDEGNTKAEQIARGIAMVLGSPDSVFVEGFDQDEERMEPREAFASMKRRQEERMKKTHLTLVRANNDRIAGWSLLHDYLRWWRIIPETQFDEEFAKRLLMTEGVLAYHEYKAKTERSASEVLPILQIWSCCPQIIDFFRNAVEAEHNTEDVEKIPGDPLDDAGDMIRYLAAKFPFKVNDMPQGAYIDQRLKAIRESGVSAQGLVMAARQAEEEWRKAHGMEQGFMLPRRAGPTLWRSAGRRVQ